MSITRASIPSRKKAGVPSSALQEVERLTYNGTVSGGTFTYAWTDPSSVVHTTAAAAYNIAATAMTTLLANAGIPASCSANAGVVLDSLHPLDIVFATPGAQPLGVVNSASLTGGGTIAVSRVITGAAGDSIGAQVGDPLDDTTSGGRYSNSGTSAAPIWTPFVSASRPPLRVGHVYGFLGDSITLYAERTDIIAGGGWPMSGVIGSKGRATYYANFGVGGDTTVNILARIATVTGSPVTKCVVLAGTNDLSTGRTVAQTWAGLQAIYAALLAAGIEPVICTLTPRPSGDAYQTLVGRLNFLIHDYAVTNDLMLIDFVPRTMDPATGTWLTGMTDGGGLHPTTALGRRTMGLAFSDVLLGNVPRNYPWMATNLKDYAAGGASILANGLFLANSGGIGTGWAVLNGTVTATCPAPSGAENTAAGGGGVLGNFQQIVYASGSRGSIFETTGAGWTVGDIVQVSGWIYATNVESSTGNAIVNYICQSSPINPVASPLINTWDMDVPLGRFCFRTKVQGGATGMYLELGVRTGTSTLKAAQLGVVNRTTLGLAN